MPEGKGTYGNQVGRPPKKMDKKKNKNEIDMSDNYLSPKEYAVNKTLKDMLNPKKTKEVLSRAGKFYKDALWKIMKKRGLHFKIKDGKLEDLGIKIDKNKKHI
tara:strand:+ start:127 stop:435 length:309 start_codon:yes stop_codon:yes gene_type:complete